MFHLSTRLARLALVVGLALVLVCGVAVAVGQALPFGMTYRNKSGAGTPRRAIAYARVKAGAAAPVTPQAVTGVCSDTFAIAPGVLTTPTAHYGGIDRPVSFYLPTGYQPTQTLPMWLALHGGSQDASVWFDPARHTIDAAESEGFMLVMPNGLPKPSQPMTSGNYFWGDDINQDYIAYLMDCVEQQYAIDAHRIYAIGFSGGAKLTYELAGRPDISPRIAAIATTAGEWGARSTSVLTSPWDILDPSAPGGVSLPALLLQGGQDRKSRLEGGFEESFDTVRTSFRVKVDAWRVFAGTTATQQISLTHAPPRVTATLHANLATGNVVVEAYDPLLAHQWPEWNYIGTIVDFFNRVPTRTLPMNQAAPAPVASTAGRPRHYEHAIASPATTFTLTPGVLQTVTLSYSNVERNVAVYAPSSYSGTQMPLLIALHGGGQDASAMFEPSKHITTWAEAEGFIAVFPNGLPRPGAPPTATNYFWDDDINVPYLNTVMDVMIANAAIDRQRVYVIGFSAGANMAYRLASDRSTSQRIAAIATVAGHVGGKRTRPATTPWVNFDPVLNGALPTSALFLQGGKDTTHPALGGFQFDGDIIVHAFQTKVDLWRLLIGQLSGLGDSANLPYAPPRVTATRYVNMNTGYLVVAAYDPVLGHAWPNWDYMGTIWSFFEEAPIRAWPNIVYLPAVMHN